MAWCEPRQADVIKEHPIRKQFLHLILLPFVAVASIPAVAQQSGYMTTDPADFAGETVSLLQLIASPLSYSGKKVRLIAYVSFDFEGEGLFLHKEDYEHALSLNASRITIPDGLGQTARKALDKRYVICEGTFVASKHHGREELFANGTLVKVTRIESWN